MTLTTLKARYLGVQISCVTSMAMEDYVLYVLARSYWVMGDGVNVDTTCSNFALL
jgi:hypothetical protein